MISTLVKTGNEMVVLPNPHMVFSIVQAAQTFDTTSIVEHQVYGSICGLLTE
jgi:hypothetical protein